MTVEAAHSKLRIYYLIGGIIAASVLSAHFLQHTFSAVATSLAIAYLLNPLLKYLDARGFSRFLSITFLYGILIFAAMITSFIFIPYLGHQLDALTQSFPLYTQRVQHALTVWKDNFRPYFNQTELDWIFGHIDLMLDHLVQEISGTGYRHLKGVFFAFFDLLLAPILVFFVLYYKEAMKNGLLSLMPASFHGDMKILGWKINRTIERYIWAMLIDCTLVGILCAMALWLLDVEFPILNGMFAGFATIVPFIGALVAVIPPAFIGYAQNGDILIIPKVCAVYFLINIVVESNIIKPLVMRGALRLNPLIVIFAVMALGETMGFWGIVMAVPVAAVISICSHELHALIYRTGTP